MNLNDSMDFSGEDNGFNAIIEKIKSADGLITAGLCILGHCAGRTYDSTSAHRNGIYAA